MSQSPPPGMYPDPSGRHNLRYWNGGAWTDRVENAAGSASDPAGASPPSPNGQPVKSGMGDGAKFLLIVGVIAAIGFGMNACGQRTSIEDPGQDVCNDRVNYSC